MCVFVVLKQDIPNMKGSWFFDKNFNGLSDETFDDLKFFDFPLEDVDANNAEEDWSALGEPCFDVFSVSPAVFCGKIKNENPQLGEGFSAPVSILSLLMIIWIPYFDVCYLLNLFSDVLLLC